MRATTCTVWLCLMAGVAGAQAAGPPPAEPSSAKPTLATEGEWELKRAEGGSACILAPKTPSRIQVVGDRLEVTGLPKDSLFNYQYRIDDQPVSNAVFPLPKMQKAGIIWLEGEAFDAVLKGRRFQIRILDKWHEAITEDVGLNGLRGLRDRAKSDCR